MIAELDAMLTDVPHLDDYFGLWAMEEARFCSIVEKVNAMDLVAHLKTNAGTPQAANGTAEYAIVDGIAVINLTGALMKRVGSLTAGTSTIRARRMVRAAAADDNVRGILLRIDSPGGTHAGTDDLADEVAKARSQKPVLAFIEDLGASAAYWIASQADRLYANRTGFVGSIGVFSVIEDYSVQAAQKGIKVHVLRAGAFKGAGVPGTEITAAQLAQWQQIVDVAYEHFLEGVAQGRGMAREVVRQLADGRVHDARSAVALGLIDGVKSIDAVFDEFGEFGRASKRRTKTMTKETEQQTHAAPSPATYQDIVGACKGADSEFVCECLKKGLTLEQCREAWMTELNTRVERAEETAREAEKKAAASSSNIGVDALPGASADTENSDPMTEFDRLVRERMGRGLERTEAIDAVAKKHPDLHKAMLLAMNPGMIEQQMVDKIFSERQRI